MPEPSDTELQTLAVMAAIVFTGGHFAHSELGYEVAADVAAGLLKAVITERKARKR